MIQWIPCKGLPDVWNLWTRIVFWCNLVSALAHTDHSMCNCSVIRWFSFSSNTSDVRELTFLNNNLLNLRTFWLFEISSMTLRPNGSPRASLHLIFFNYINFQILELHNISFLPCENIKIVRQLTIFTIHIN